MPLIAISQICVRLLIKKKQTTTPTLGQYTKTAWSFTAANTV